MIRLIDKIEFYADPQLEREQRELGSPANVSYVEVYMEDGTVCSKKSRYVGAYGPLRSDEAVRDSFVKLAKYVEKDVVQEK